MRLKRILACLAALGIVGLLAAFGRDATPQSGPEVRAEVEARNPWTGLHPNNAADVFRFAIVSDRTGGHRAGVFARAVEQLNWMQPEFVICVGDLVEGATAERLPGEWKEFETLVGRLPMPFFFVPGNHDFGAHRSPAWTERFGRDHYHFTYKGVLFLVLNSNVETSFGRLGRAQVEWAKRVLADNANARWTVVVLHHPLWHMPLLDRSEWLDIEKALAGRKYTVICGHFHTYRKWVRQGMNYYMLATTGGASGLSGPAYGQFDEIAWVTMKPEGPVLCNLMTDGIYPDDLVLPRPTESAGPGDDPRTVPWPRVELRVLVDGKPAAGKLVSVYPQPARPNEPPPLFGYVGPDGLVVPIRERLRPGTYAVTVSECNGQLTGRPVDAEVRALHSPPVAAAYGHPETSELKIDVTGGRVDTTRATLDLRSAAVPAGR